MKKIHIFLPNYPPQASYILGKGSCAGIPHQDRDEGVGRNVNAGLIKKSPPGMFHLFLNKTTTKRNPRLMCCQGNLGSKVALGYIYDEVTKT